jgi:hypothetical protein
MATRWVDTGFPLANNAKARLRGDHAQTESEKRDDDSKKSHPALVRHKRHRQADFPSGYLLNEPIRRMHRRVCLSGGASNRPITLQFLIWRTWGFQNDIQGRPPSAVLVAQERPKGITSRVIIVALAKRVIVRHLVPTISRPARPVGERVREPGKIGKRQIVLVSGHHNGQSAGRHTVPPDLSPWSGTTRPVEQENAGVCCNVMFVAKIQRHGFSRPMLVDGEPPSMKRLVFKFAAWANALLSFSAHFRSAASYAVGGA